MPFKRQPRYDRNRDDGRGLAEQGRSEALSDRKNDARRGARAPPRESLALNLRPRVSTPPMPETSAPRVGMAVAIPIRSVGVTRPSEQGIARDDDQPATRWRSSAPDRARRRHTSLPPPGLGTSPSNGTGVRVVDCREGPDVSRLDLPLCRLGPAARVLSFAPEGTALRVVPRSATPLGVVLVTVGRRNRDQAARKF